MCMNDRSYEFRNLTRGLSQELKAAGERALFLPQQVRGQFPESLILENIVCGYAFIRHPQTYERFIADFRSFLGSTTLSHYFTHNRFHIQRIRSIEKRLRKQINEKVYGDVTEPIAEGPLVILNIKYWWA